MKVGYEYDVYLKLNPQRECGSEIYIITRRQDRTTMRKALKEKGLFCHKLLTYEPSSEFDMHELARFKQRLIHYYLINTYFEDNPQVARHLKSLCPTCKVILKEFNDDEDAIPR